ncbi:MltA domain-containing protein [Neisseria gonorrhoeae]|nr:MltA domain-containing protein [Neisseria gonorrhoeae]WLF14388.1 MltA domain-containing protein [Neisseria gonorrhoeae]
MKGRFEGSRFLPYHTRNQINGGALDGKAPILGYAKTPSNFFSCTYKARAVLKTPSGKYIRIGYADKNEHPYVSIDAIWRTKATSSSGKPPCRAIKSYMRQNPHKLAEVLGQNPSYIFFRELAEAAMRAPSAHWARR